MKPMHRLALVALFLAAAAARGDEWQQFRGPDGQGVSKEKGLPVEWSAEKNIAWKTKLPGAGASSPVTAGNSLFVTCYSGYGMEVKDPGDMKKLRRHLVRIDRTDGKILWTKDFEPVLPEHNYQGEGAYHGYAASTPIVEGDRIYVFFGKSGVFCFDLDGNIQWQTPVGKNTSGWGSGTSPVVHKDLVIVNASVESGAMVALDKATGKEKWRTPKIGSSWNTPILASNGDKETELVVSVQGRVVSIEPESGKERWWADFAKSYICPSVVSNGDVIYAIGAGSQSAAIRTGGSGDVNASHVLWRQNRGSNAGSPIYRDGHLYWASESGGVLHCQNVADGKSVYSERLKPDAGRIWASPVYADGKLYYVSQFNGVFVVAAGPKFAVLAHNVIADDKSRSNASLAVSNGQLFLRNDAYLYCIGKR